MESPRVDSNKMTYPFPAYLECKKLHKCRSDKVSPRRKYQCTPHWKLPQGVVNVDYLERLDSLVEEGIDLLSDLGHTEIVTAMRFRMERENMVSLSHLELAI